MAMLSFKGCNFDCIGCTRKRNEYDIYAEERKSPFVFRDKGDTGNTREGEIY